MTSNTLTFTDFETYMDAVYALTVRGVTFTGGQDGASSFTITITGY